MKISFENLGALEIGNIEIADLTVVCGKNNTGKTYLTYAIYGLLKTWKSFLKIAVPDLSRLSSEGATEIDLKKLYLDKAKYLIQESINEYTTNLHQVLAAKDNRFESARISVDFDIPDDYLDTPYEKDYNTPQNKRLITFSKPSGSPYLKITSLMEEGEHNARFSPRSSIDREIRALVFNRLLPEAFIVSTERTGAITFRSELNLAKNRLIEMANNVKPGEQLNPIGLIQSFYGSGYPLPVKDNVDFINQLSVIESGTSLLLKQHPSLTKDMEDILGGAYKVSKDGELGFSPTGSKSVRLRMGESSSAVRSLVIFSHYLKHIAKPGDLLMIDEPELNLHPENQRKIARLLAKMVNAGVRVFVTTHSDYIIKEFNTLIMLNRASDKLEAIRLKYHYENDEKLDPKKVRLYMICTESVLKRGAKKRGRAQTLKLAGISNNLGFEVPTFDGTIDQMNEIQDALYYASEPSK